MENDRIVDAVIRPVLKDPNLNFSTTSLCCSARILQVSAGVMTYFSMIFDRGCTFHVKHLIPR
jgi:hypothetical protein